VTTSNRALRFLARWVMRIEACKGVLQLGLFGGTFLTTGLTALHQYGYSQYARPFITVVGVGILVFAYAYTESGVYNQKNRDKKDIGTNYVGPNLFMRYQMQARQLAALYRALENGHDPHEFETELIDDTEEQWADLRNGVDEEMLEANQ